MKYSIILGGLLQFKIWRSFIVKKLEILGHWEIFDKKFTIYGTVVEPLFLAKEVARLIDHSQVVRMIENIDNNEKVMNSIHTLGGEQKCWFLTEDGLYEVLMQSRKPIAKQFKKKVKEILKEIRKTGSYGVQPVQPPTMCIEDMIIAQAKLLKELRLKVERQERKINDLTRKPFSECGYFTIREWLELKKIPYQASLVKSLSRRCAKYSRDNAIEIKYINNISLNKYRSDVLEKMFSNKPLQLPAPKKHKNIVYAMARFFNTWKPEERLIAIENFQEFFIQAPSKFQGAIWEALTTDINKIPEYIELKTMEKVS